MNVGISTASLFGREYNEEALVTFENLGIEVCEIFLESFCEYTTEYANLLKSKLSKVKVHSIHTLNTHFEPQLFSRNDRSYNDAYRIFEGVLKCAKILDAKNYIFHGRIRTKRANFSNYEETGNFFNKLTDLSKTYGVEVNLENVEWAMNNHVGYFEALKPYSKDLRACLDIKQARLSGYDYHGYLNEMADRLNTVHISDYDSDGKIVLPGKGLFDFEKFIGELNSVNFNGAILLEVYNDSFKTLDQLVESLEYIKNLVKRG